MIEIETTVGMKCGYSYLALYSVHIEFSIIIIIIIMYNAES